MWFVALAGLARAEAPEPEEVGLSAPVEAAPLDELEPIPPEGPPPAEAPVAPVPIVLPEPEGFPSALDDKSPIQADGSIGDLLALWRAERRDVWSGRNIVRPLLSMRFDEQGGRPLQLGLSLGRQWWQLKEGAKATLEAVATGEAALAGGKGSWHADLTVLVGTNVGPLGIQAGQSVIGDQTVVEGAALGTVAALAPVAGLTLDLRVVQLAGSVAPRFFVAGDRPAAQVLVGDEPVVRAGAGLGLGRLHVLGDWSRRWTAAGALDRVGLGFRVRL